MLTKVILALLFLGVAVSAKVTREELTAVKTALTTAIELNNKCENSADCVTIPVGSRACGGPAGFAVYAVKSANAENIRSLAQLSTKLEQQYNQDNSVMSICSIAMPPTPMCDQNKCVAGSRSSSFQPMLVQ